MRSRLVPLLAVLALLLGACGGGTDDPGQAGDEETTPPDAATETETSVTDEDTAMDEDAGTDAGAEGETTVAVASSDLGDILVDGEGMTLYVFIPDDQGTPTCTDDCAETWPPFEGPASADEGVDEGLLGTADHPDGTTMATYNDWPLYHFAPDEQPGDTQGQGVGDNWFVIGPDGEPVRDSADAVSGY